MTERLVHLPTTCTFNYVVLAPKDASAKAFHAGRPFTTALTLFAPFLSNQEREYVLLKILACLPIPYGNITCNGPCDDTTCDIITLTHPDGSHWLHLATT